MTRPAANAKPGPPLTRTIPKAKTNAEAAAASAIEIRGLRPPRPSTAPVRIEMVRVASAPPQSHGSRAAPRLGSAIPLAIRRDVLQAAARPTTAGRSDYTGAP